MPTSTYPWDVADTGLNSRLDEAAVDDDAGHGHPTVEACEPDDERCVTDDARAAHGSVELGWIAISAVILVVIVAVVGLGWLPVVEAPPASL